MTWPTHALFGVNIVWLLAPLLPLVPEANVGVLCGVAALGALLPDLDASESKIKHLKLLGTQIKPFYFPALMVSRSDQHRGLLHSLWGVGLAAVSGLFLLPWIGGLAWTALVLGYASHLLADAMTKSGIRLLYPSLRRLYLLPKALRIATGSLSEDALLPFLAGGAILLLLGSL